MRVRRTKAEIAAGVTLEQAKANREAEVKQEIITEPVSPVEELDEDITDYENIIDVSPIGLDEDFEFDYEIPELSNEDGNE